jgi:hypothetical protein
MDNRIRVGIAAPLSRPKPYEGSAKRDRDRHEGQQQKRELAVIALTQILANRQPT